MPVFCLELDVFMHDNQNENYTWKTAGSEKGQRGNREKSTKIELYFLYRLVVCFSST